MGLWDKVSGVFNKISNNMKNNRIRSRKLIDKMNDPKWKDKVNFRVGGKGSYPTAEQKAKAAASNNNVLGGAGAKLKALANSAPTT